MELQENKVLPSLKGLKIGMKLKLHSFAIPIAILSKLGVRSTQLHITTFSHIFGCGLLVSIRMESKGLAHSLAWKCY